MKPSKREAMYSAARQCHADGLTGSVVVVTTFDRYGQPISARVTSSSGSSVLDAHARKTVLRAMCPRVPKSGPGRTVPVTTTFRYGEHAGKPCEDLPRL